VYWAVIFTVFYLLYLNFYIYIVCILVPVVANKLHHNVFPPYLIALHPIQNTSEILYI